MFVLSQNGAIVNLDSVSVIYVLDESYAGKFGVFAVIPCFSTIVPTPTYIPAPMSTPLSGRGESKIFLAQYSDIEEVKNAFEELVQAIEQGKRIHIMREARNEKEGME